MPRRDIAQTLHVGMVRNGVLVRVEGGACLYSLPFLVQYRQHHVSGSSAIISNRSLEALLSFHHSI